jgi:hypothetical protein
MLPYKAGFGYPRVWFWGQIITRIVFYAVLGFDFGFQVWVHKDSTRSESALLPSLLVKLQEQSCPIVHKRTCVTDNRDWISYNMPFKAHSIPCLPYRPTYGSNPNGMKFLAKRQTIYYTIPNNSRKSLGYL